MSDALDRLKRKNRPKVKPRNTQVDQQDVDIQASRHIDVQTQGNQDTYSAELSKSKDIQTSRHIDGKTLAQRCASGLGEIDASRSEDIQTSRYLDVQASPIATSSGSSANIENLEVKRSTFRLEVGLIGRLHRLCQDNGISREVMIESMFEYMEQDPEALNQVIRVAKSKNIHRQQIANRKRAKAMIEKFG